MQDQEEQKEDINFLSLLYQRNTFTTANLQVQLEANLDKIRRKQWLEEFPKGSTLLTYLYRITLACEADLTVVELLRRIFARAVSPLLRMISEFITVGAFEDPFSEFFIQKLASKSDKAGAIYRLEPEKVPAFFQNETAEMIFALGSDINLLRQHKPVTSDGDLPDYYKICTVPINNDV